MTRQFFYIRDGILEESCLHEGCLQTHLHAVVFSPMSGFLLGVGMGLIINGLKSASNFSAPARLPAASRFLDAFLDIFFTEDLNAN